jgi:hypothetical protein
VLLSLEEKHQPSFRFIYYFRLFFSFSGRVWLVKEKGRGVFDRSKKSDGSGFFYLDFTKGRFYYMFGKYTC